MPFKKNVNAVNKMSDTSYLYEKLIIVNGHKTKALIDTESSCTLVRTSVVEKHSMIVSVTSDHVLKDFAGQSVISNRSTACEIKIMNTVVRVNAIVVPDNYLTYDVIVGRDFLEQEHIMIVKRGKELMFKQLPAIKRVDKNIDVNFSDVQRDDTIIIRTDANEEVKQQCAALIWEFRDCVSFSIKDLGKTDATMLNIRCTSEIPVNYRPYRLSESEKQVTREIVRELLINNIIRESNSPYASPILLVKKKNNEYRLCIDYRKLNAITIKDKYSMPLIEEQIDKLGGNRYFTGLDLASGYYQVPVAADSIEKTAFITPEGHYEFLRMPFGLTNAPAVFQQLMDRVLNTLKNSIAFPYLDDVIIPSRTIEEGMTRLRQVLETFRMHHLTLKLEKCSFFSQFIEYLEREISEQGV